MTLIGGMSTGIAYGILNVTPRSLKSTSERFIFFQPNLPYT